MDDLKARWDIDLGLGGSQTAKFGAPVSFSAHLDGLLPGIAVPLDTSALANGYRTPYVIDEIRMQAYMATPSVGVTNRLDPANSVSFQFRTGHYELGQAPVPMMLFSPEYGGNPIPTDIPREVYGVSPTFANRQYCRSYRWTLGRPLWMAPGDMVQAVVNRSATIAIGDGTMPFSIDVTYVGRSLPPGTTGPRVRYVPHAAHLTYDFATAFQQSNNEYRNPYGVPLVINRFVGRPGTKFGEGGATGFSPAFRQAMLPVASNAQYCSLYVEDSLAYKVTRDWTPAGLLFDTEKCTWTFNRALERNQKFNVQFRTDGATVNPFGLTFGMSMLGYREES